MPAQPSAIAPAPRFAVVGAGMSGILCGIRLMQAGYEHVIYEKADRLGGTWRENTYPGIACDVPSHFYSYSFAPTPSGRTASLRVPRSRPISRTWPSGTA